MRGLDVGRYVALYRGINVGGRNAVNMESLRSMHEGLGHRGVKNYIQSGNIVFEGTGAAAAVRAVSGRFAEEFGFEARVMVVTAGAWGELVRNNPYAKLTAKDPKTVHACVCDGAPDAAGLKALLEKTGGSEAYTVKGRVVYLHAPDGFGTSKFAARLERACGVPITARNWSTVVAIWELLSIDG